PPPPLLLRHRRLARVTHPTVDGARLVRTMSFRHVDPPSQGRCVEARLGVHGTLPGRFFLPFPSRVAAGGNRSHGAMLRALASLRIVDNFGSLPGRSILMTPSFVSPASLASA